MHANGECVHGQLKGSDGGTAATKQHLPLLLCWTGKELVETFEANPDVQDAPKREERSAHLCWHTYFNVDFCTHALCSFEGGS